MIKKSLEWFGGSVVVYVLVAACAGHGKDDGVTGSNNGGASGPVDSGNLTGGKGNGSILDPVPEAEAAEDGSRLKVMRIASADGLKVPTGGVWDSQLNIECFRSMAEDGAFRCLPRLRMNILNLFADSGCTQAVSSWDQCDSAPEYMVNSYRDNNCIVSRIWRTGPEVDKVYVKSGNDCIEAVGQSDYRHFRVGAAVPASSFAELSLEYD